MHPSDVTILAVDDSAAMRQLIEAALSDAGYRVVTAKDGQDALAVVAKHPAQLVVTDRYMPVMDGVALIRALRAKPEYDTVPILVLTTESSPESKAEGRAAGATGWLLKPFDPDVLVSVVNSLVLDA